MGFLTSKTARVGVFYVLLCALMLIWSQHERLGSCIDWRLALLREMEKDKTLAPDVIFLGSSRTVRGIRPLVAEEVYAKSPGALHSSLNLATNGLPRHMNALTLEDWLDHHPPPKIVCVEFGDIELAPWPHELLGNISTAADALRLFVRAPYFVRGNKQYNAMMALNKEGKAFTLAQQMSRRHWHFEYALQVLGRGPEDVVRTAFNCIANALTAPAGHSFWSELENPYRAIDPPIEQRTLREQVDAHGWYRMDPQNELLRLGRVKVAEMAAKPDNSLEKANARRRSEVLDGNPVYLADVLETRRIAKLCREHKIRLVFYSMPPFRDGQMSQAHEDFLRSLGEIFIPDMASLELEENYADVGHLSDLGAERYTREFATFLAR